MKWRYGQLASRLGWRLLCLAVVGSVLIGCVSSTGAAGPAGPPGPAGPQGVQGPPGPPAAAPGNQLVWRCTGVCIAAGCLPEGSLTLDRNRCAKGPAEDTDLRVR